MRCIFAALGRWVLLGSLGWAQGRARARGSGAHWRRSSGLLQMSLQAGAASCCRVERERLKWELAACKDTRQGKASGGRRFQVAETRLNPTGRVDALLNPKTAAVKVTL